VNKNEEDRLLYRLAKQHGIKKRDIAKKYYIPHRMPDKKESVIKNAGTAVIDFLNPLKPF
jgi:hypothetical protein